MDQPDVMVITEGPYLRVTLRGPALRGGLLQVLERVFAETQSHNVWRVLVDLMSVPTPVGTFEKYQLGTEFARRADRRLTVAVLARTELVDHFFETVARNRGGAVAVFTEESAALHWLVGTV